MILVVIWDTVNVFSTKYHTITNDAKETRTEQETFNILLFSTVLVYFVYDD